MCVCPRTPGGRQSTPHSPSPRHVSYGAGTLVRCCALALLCAALAHAERPKRAESEPSKELVVPFVMGSRYGRSAERVMAPRNDRFFMGSRYGKRSAGDEWLEEARGVRRGCAGGDCRLKCTPVGMLHLYKCVHDLPSSYDRRSGIGTRAGAGSGGEE